MTSKVCQFLNESGGTNFTENTPRPPVLPGEENELQSTGGMSTRSSGSHKSQVSSKSHVSSKSISSNKSLGSNRGEVAHSPAATPRRCSNLDKTLTHNCSGLDDDMAPLGYEPEGSVANSPPFTENSTPPYMKWAENLKFLLDDRDGVQLFRSFLEQEGLGSYSVDFWFACRGLKKKKPDDMETILNVIKVIHKKFIKNDKLPCVGGDSKRKITENINKRTQIDQFIFDSAQSEVELDMRNNTYPLFLKSDLYVQYVQKGGESPKSSNTSSGSNSARPMSGPLPTLPEDSELQNEDISLYSLMGPPTSSNVLSSRSHGDTSGAKKPDMVYTRYPLPYNCRTPVPHPYHVSYAPVSAQDSELQSLSSDALTDDTRSLTDSSVDAFPTGHSKGWSKKYRKHIQRKAEQNRECSSNPPFIPRTERAPKDRNIAEVEPQRFAAMLIDKLTKVLQEREKDERINESLGRVLNETSVEDVSINNNRSVLMNTSATKNNTATTSMIQQMTSSLLEEENADSILEEHCSRVWDTSNQQTPSRSPGRKSPDRLFKKPQIQTTVPQSLPGTLHNKSIHHKKRQEFCSTFSFDSGVGEEKPAALETHKHIHHHHHHHHMREVKTKQQLELEAQHHSLSCWEPPASGRLHSDYIPGSKDPDKSRTTGKRPNRKHSDASSNIDSGISMIESLPPGPNLTDPSTSKVWNWLESAQQNEKNTTTTSSGYTDSEKSSSHRRSHRLNLPNTAPPPAHKQMASKKVAHGSSRSTSVERSNIWPPISGATQVVPNQPFAVDPSMPLLAPPNTTVQLEEAKRRLEVDQARTIPVKSKSFAGVPSKEKRTVPMSPSTSQVRPAGPPAKGLPSDLDVCADGASGTSFTEKKTQKKMSTSIISNTSIMSETEGTVVGYYLCGEPIPYRIVVPDKNLTLGQFKALISKRGHYRYFFKQLSDEFETSAVFEEIRDDSVVLPLWEGKVVAKVDRVE